RTGTTSRDASTRGAAWRRCSSSEPDEDEADHHRRHRPQDEHRQRDQARWERPVEKLHANDHASEAEKSHAVVKREQQDDDAEDDEGRRAVGRVTCRPIARALDLDQQPEEPQREWQCGELADDVKQVVTFSRPPAGRHAPEVLTPLSLTLSPLGRGDRFCRHSLFPSGRRKRIVVSSLVCWIAFAGSTPFGHTTEHSRTKLHSHTPSESPITGSLCFLPWP